LDSRAKLTSVTDIWGRHWNPDPIIRTLCAFANDFENLGGGYIIIGQDCDAEGQPIFPPVGLHANQIDKIQKELLNFSNLIQPPYFPVLSVERFEGRNLIVLWAPGGQTRPYKAPKSVSAKKKEYWGWGGDGVGPT